MNELSLRLFNFSVNVSKLTKTLSDIPEFKVLRYQLVKSSSSTAANYEEAQGASSRADFHNKVLISLREMRESNFWLRQLFEINEDAIAQEKISRLISESGELKKILGSIASKTKK